MPSFLVGADVVLFDALQQSYGEKVLSPNVRDITLSVLLTGANSWETLASLTTTLDKERLPSGEYHIDEQGGAGQGALLLDSRGSWAAYLTDATLTEFYTDSEQYLVSCAFTITSGAPEP